MVGGVSVAASIVGFAEQLMSGKDQKWSSCGVLQTPFQQLGLDVSDIVAQEIRGDRF